MDTRQQRNPTVSPDEWYTPRWIIDTLGPFDLDPCAPPADVRPYEIAPTAYTRDDDGLSREWHGTVWMNPPYSRVPLRRFCERLAGHGNGIALLVNRQDNLLWQEVIFPTAKSMIFMRHRVRFLRPDGTTGSPFFGSCLVAWGDACDRRLRQSGIEGQMLTVSAEDIDFNRAASENVQLQDTNLPAQFAIGLKNSSLMAMLQVAAKTENVIISLADATRAILIRPEDVKDSTTALCMPMLLDK